MQKSPYKNIDIVQLSYFNIFSYLYEIMALYIDRSNIKDIHKGHYFALSTVIHRLVLDDFANVLYTYIR